MPLVRRLRLPALFCALAVLVCELIARPHANMGICDDGPYILIAQKLATTGHIFYNGNTTPMLGWQLYLGAAFIKLFGFSYTTVRMSTLVVAVALAFVLQRTLVRANISECNASIGTLALVLSPLYLMLSVTYMTDIFGLFGMVLCLYGCLRALQSSTDRSTIAWLCCAVATNAICGSSRQVAWLGILVMVPSTLWLLRSRRRVFLAGAAATLAGALFVLGCMLWFLHQPYNVHEPLIPSTFPVAHTLWQLIFSFLDIPFLLLPIAALFLLEIRKCSPRVIAGISALLLGYLFLAIYPSHLRGGLPLEPTQGDWVNVHAVFEYLFLKGDPPLFLHTGVRVLLTIASFGGLLGLIASFLGPKATSSMPSSTHEISWKQLSILILPFTIAYTLLLVPRAAAFHLTDRYLLGLLGVVLIYLVRYYQDRIQPRLPFASILLVGVMMIYGIAVTHNMFTLYRARVVLAAELRADGIPDTFVDNGWEYNFGVELQNADFVNDPRVVIHTQAYVPTPPIPVGTCYWYFDPFPHIHPLYGISFDPNACYGPAPFAPVHYSRWLASGPGTLYVVRYTASSKP